MENIKRERSIGIFRGSPDGATEKFSREGDAAKEVAVQGVFAETT
jgi:hypothetical protein